MPDPADAKALFARLAADPAAWANEVAIAAAGLAKVAYLNYYYALGVDATHVGAGGLIDHDDASPNDLFYDVAKTWNA